MNNCHKAVCAVPFDVWHRRLGHISNGKLSLVHDLGIVSNKMRHFVCDICPQAKQHRLPFLVSSISTTKAFELIHVDTWGPYHTKTYSGHRYFLTIVDDFTRATWTHLMVTKDDIYPKVLCDND